MNCGLSNIRNEPVKCVFKVMCQDLLREAEGDHATIQSM
jgi:hypothetical protein